MNVSSSCIFLTLLYAFVLTAECIQDLKRPDAVDGLLVSLRHEQWSEEEAPCLQATTALLEGVRNQTLWATWIWNSMQLPVGTFYGSGYHLGSFDQCLQVPWTNRELEMQYCLVDVTLSEEKPYEGEISDPYINTKSFISKKSRFGLSFNRLSFGVCLPAVCLPSSVAKISRHLYQMSYLPFDHVQVNPLDCQTARQKVEPSTMFYLYWCFLFLLSTIVVVVYFMGKDETNTTISKILHCFSPSRNYEALLKTGESEIHMMHGMRFMTSGILVAAHYIVFSNVAVFNIMDCEKSVAEGFGAYLSHLDSCVDTFFLMSGLLHIKGLMSSKSTKPFNVLAKRYLRLLGPLALTVATFVYVYPHLGSGPIWPRMTREHHEPCVKGWWRNLLMLGNRDDQGEYCIVASWYICSDYQLTVFGMLLFLLYKNKRSRAFILFALAAILSFLVPGVIMYQNKLPGVLFYDFGESTKPHKNLVFEAIYRKSYARTSAYLFGIAMGYLMSIYKPKDYRKTISKFTSIVGFVCGLYLMLLVLRIGANLMKKEYSELVATIYAAVDKSIWSLGICLIIFVCEYGTLPIVSDLLSSKIFVPLSKLSYLTYLTHSVFIYCNVYSMRVPVNFNFFQMVVSGVGYVGVTYAFSYLLWFILEAPSNNLITLLFEERKPKSFQRDIATPKKDLNSIEKKKTS